ncbi:Rrf2 family transcriptional regulator [Nocardioides sp. 1609]|uniref:RrF2 family transcriptional regulator n=1 Tax=Nocardioides sp. 1609 TaxID=2508327 RepID=UPI00106F89EC|nr:Rrf2 family transcriptional regulator [Nocardioides sp. 1609]
MKLSIGVERALSCCLVLAAAQRSVPAAGLAVILDLSPTYLAKQLQLLARAGLLTSAQGRSGGYRLARPATGISVLDVVQAVGGSEYAFRCTEIRQRGPLAAPSEACVGPCAVAAVMHAAEEAWRAALGAVTLADLAVDVSDDIGSGVVAAIHGGLSRQRDPARGEGHDLR